MDCDKYRKVFFHWDKTVIIITIIVFLLLLGTAIGVTYPAWNIRVGIVYLVILSPIIITFLYLPIYLKVDDSNLIIRRIKGKRKIPIESMDSILPIEKRDIASSTRIWGSGGLFGYIGTFKNSKYGRYKMYATELSNLYLIKTSNSYFVVSCQNSQFITTLMSKIK